jgi:hypothetical protein
MRDIERIDRILGKIRALWFKHPDQRLYQLLINDGLFPDGPLWNVEDDKVEEHLKGVKVVNMKAELGKLTGEEMKVFDKLISKDGGYVEATNYLLKKGKLVIK